MNKALFLDRDGVINIDYGHVYKISDFHPFKEIFSICKRYQDDGFIIVVISNQAGIAKGLYSQSDLDLLDNYMKNVFLDNGIKITASYYCPHKEEDMCDCRKPKPGLILKAKKDLDIDLAKSILIGDKMSDLMAGYNAGIKKLFLHPTRYEITPVEFEYTTINYK